MVSWIPLYLGIWFWQQFSPPEPPWPGTSWWTRGGRTITRHSTRSAHHVHPEINRNSRKNPKRSNPEQREVPILERLYFIRNVPYRVFCLIIWKKRIFSQARYPSFSLLQLLCSKIFFIIKLGNQIVFEDSNNGTKKSPNRIGVGIW